MEGVSIVNNKFHDAKIAINLQTNFGLSTTNQIFLMIYSLKLLYITDCMVDFTNESQPLLIDYQATSLRII